MKYVNQEHIKAINSVTRTRNSLTSVQAGFFCQVSCEQALRLQSLLHRGVEGEALGSARGRFHHVWVGASHPPPAPYAPSALTQGTQCMDISHQARAGAHTRAHTRRHVR